MRRIPALDGLRAVAIAMVVGYHIDKTVVPAGHWGVTLFFVLSGFVITGSLCAEVDRTGRLVDWGLYTYVEEDLLTGLVYAGVGGGG